MEETKITEWNVMDYIKTKEDLHNYVDAAVEPYAKGLKLALVILKEIQDMSETEIRHNCVQTLAGRWAKKIIRDLEKEGIPDPTALKDE